LLFDLDFFLVGFFVVSSLVGFVVSSLSASESESALLFDIDVGFVVSSLILTPIKSALLFDIDFFLFLLVGFVVSSSLSASESESAFLFDEDVFLLVGFVVSIG